MSYHDYTVAKTLYCDDAPFYALIMAAMLRADSYNVQVLASVYPRVWAELDARYHAPGGRIATDPEGGAS